MAAKLSSRKSLAPRLLLMKRHLLTRRWAARKCPSHKFIHLNFVIHTDQSPGQEEADDTSFYKSFIFNHFSIDANSFVIIEGLYSRLLQIGFPQRQIVRRRFMYKTLIGKHSRDEY